MRESSKTRALPVVWATLGVTGCDRDPKSLSDDEIPARTASQGRGESQERDGARRRGERNDGEDLAFITTSAGLGARCLQKGGCAACTACALIGPCATLYVVCKLSDDCTAIDQCFDTCKHDASCEQQCYATYPEGELAYRAVLKVAVLVGGIAGDGGLAGGGIDSIAGVTDGAHDLVGAAVRDEGDGDGDGAEHETGEHEGSQEHGRTSGSPGPTGRGDRCGGERKSGAGGVRGDIPCGARPGSLG
jgi:hypothetical protein